MNRIVVEIEGGCLKSVHAKEPLEVILLDRDDLMLDYDLRDPVRALRALSEKWPDVAEALRVVDDALEVDREQFPLQVW